MADIVTLVTSWGSWAGDARIDERPPDGYSSNVYVWVWDRGRWSQATQEYNARVAEVEAYAGTRAYPHPTTFPNGMRGRVLWAGGEGMARFYPEEHPPNWRDFVYAEYGVEDWEWDENGVLVACPFCFPDGDPWCRECNDSGGYRAPWAAAGVFNPDAVR